MIGGGEANSRPAEVAQGGTSRIPSMSSGSLDILEVGDLARRWAYGPFACCDPFHGPLTGVFLEFRLSQMEDTGSLALGTGSSVYGQPRGSCALRCYGSRLWHRSKRRNGIDMHVHRNYRRRGQTRKS